MAHFLLELYSEEIPHGLQIDTRKNIESLFKKKLEELRRKAARGDQTR